MGGVYLGRYRVVAYPESTSHMWALRVLGRAPSWSNESADHIPQNARRDFSRDQKFESRLWFCWVRVTYEQAQSHLSAGDYTWYLNLPQQAS